MRRIAIIGAGISGLYIVKLLKKNSNNQITIYERNNAINLEEGYGIQLSVNSIKLLNEIEFDRFQTNEKFNPKNIIFYSNKNFNKICELDLEDFNLQNSKYTTLKRSTLINFLKKDLDNIIKTNHSISKIDQLSQKIKLTFENNEIHECDNLIIADGVFSKSKTLISNYNTKPKYNNTVAIRGVLAKPLSFVDIKNISIFLDSNFHQVIYPINSHGDLNFIAIMKYSLTKYEQKNFSLFNDEKFLEKIIKKIPPQNQKLLKNLEDLKIFPIFVSDIFCKIQKKNIHLIGDAFFAFPPSFAQGASQSIESAYDLFKCFEDDIEIDFFKKRVNKTKMINTRSKLNQFSFHLSNPLTIFFRNFILKRLVKNKNFLEAYLGKIYRN